MTDTNSKRSDRQRQLTQKRKVGAAYQKGLKETKLPHVTVTVHPNGQTVIRSTMSKDQTIAVLIAVVARYTPQPTVVPSESNAEDVREDADGGYAIQEPSDEGVEAVLALREAAS